LHLYLLDCADFSHDLSSFLFTNHLS
jgi:hypothetical protein